MILDNRVFDNFILVDNPSAKALRIFKTWASLEFPAKCDKCFKAIWVPFSIPDFKLLSCRLGNFATIFILSRFILK